MRIVNLKEFMALPKGTVFMKYVPSVFGELSIKGENSEVTFMLSNVTQDVDCTSSYDLADILDEAENNSQISIKMDFECFYWDSFYEDKQLFAVYEQKDIDGLIEALKICKGA